MKQQILVFAILSIGAAVPGSSQIPNSAEIAKQHSSVSARKGGTANRQQKNPPIATPSVPATQGREQNPANASSNSYPDQRGEDIQIQRQMAQFTAELVIVGAIQALALFGTVIVAVMQARTLREHSEHFEELAARLRDQVELSRKTLVAQFRPKIIVRSIRFDPSSVEEFDQRTNPTWKIEISIVNAGDTVAHVKYCEAISFWMDNLRRSRAHIATEEWEPYSLNPGEIKRLILLVEQRTFRTNLNVVERAIKRGNGSQEFPVCSGFISYADENGHIRETGFERRWDVQRRRFIASEDPESEYSE